MRLAQCAALCVEALAGEEGIVSPSCASTKERDRVGLSGARSASTSVDVAEAIDKRVVMSRSVAEAMIASRNATRFYLKPIREKSLWRS